MKLREVDLNLLVALDALIRERHVSRAAEQLDISQSSMSLALARLRTLFHDPLLVKANNRLEPTARAQELAPSVKQLLRGIDQLIHEQAPFEPLQAHETITMIVTDYVEFVLMPELMATLEREAPGIVLRILGPNPKRLGEVMSTGQVDLALSYFPNPPDNLRTRPLFEDRMVGIARLGHPMLESAVAAERLFDFGHVTIEPGEATMYSALLDEVIRASGRQRRVALTKPTFLGVPFVLARTDLVAALPKRVADRFVELGVVGQFELPLPIKSFKVVQLWHDRTHNSPLHRWFRDMLTRIGVG